MARDRRSHVRKKGQPRAANLPAGVDFSDCNAASAYAPHPSLVEIVRLLAQQAARADIAAQRAARPSED